MCMSTPTKIALQKFFSVDKNIKSVMDLQELDIFDS